MIDPQKIQESAQADFEKTWLESAAELPRNTTVQLKGRGRLHPVRQMMEKSRQILSGMGFTEMENKTILPEEDVYKQYGPEAPVILDRAFYLATLPRPDIGIGADKVDQIRGIIGEFNVDRMQELLREYKKGKIESDDFVDRLSAGLRIKPEQATAIISDVLPELKGLKPIASNMTLRSHATGTWYHTLAAMQDGAEFPVALFAVAPRYRNEQREDSGHLKVHHSASIVIMDPKMSLEAGREIAKEILQKYGFKETKFERKRATSKYYAPQQEEEVFVKHNGKWLEIADIGMYSPVSLANFNIRHPVFNAGFGIERLVMVLDNVDDIRKLVFPQFYGKVFTDQDIASSIRYANEPRTERGWSIAKAIEKTASRERASIAPCRFTAYEDDEIKVDLVETEAGKKLAGPAAFNLVCVRDGNIYSDITDSGVPTGKSYISGISAAVAHGIEQGRTPFTYKVKNVKALSDINLTVPKDIREFIEGNQKRMSIKGYTFVEVQVEAKQKRDGVK